jgi:DNA-binding transcriptional LysR family regulator
MFRDFAFQKFSPMPVEVARVSSSSAPVADDVGGQNGCQSSRDAIFAHAALALRMPSLRAFEDQHPTARVLLREMNSAMQFDALMRGQIDIGFIHGLPLPGGIESILMMSEPFICCVPIEITRRTSSDAPVELRVGFAPSMIFRRLPDFLNAGLKRGLRK